MKKEEWNQGLNHLDSDLVEEYVQKKDRLDKKRATRAVWMRMGVIAACLCLLASAVLVAPMLTKQSPGDVPDQTSEETTTDEHVFPPQGPKFDGEVLQVLSWKSEIPAYVEDLSDSATLLEQAIFERCESAETELNIKTEWTLVDNINVESLLGNETVGGTKYDLLVCDNELAIDLTIRGAFSNLLQYEHFDTYFPWQKSLTEDLVLGNKLYFATGHISPDFILNTSVVFFNKNLVKDLHIREKIQDEWGEQDLYDLVKSGKWTLDKMITLSQGVYLDQNDSKTKDKGDRYGLSTYSEVLDNFYYGGGYTTVSSNGTELHINSAYLDANGMDSLLTQVNGLLYASNDGILEESALDAQTTFAGGKALFSLATASHAYYHYCSVEQLNYCVLPVPKHVESQTAYASVALSGYSTYGIFSQSDEPEIAAAFLQTFAERSYSWTTPALLDRMMKGRYAEDVEDVKMWEYAVEANVLDIGRIFAQYFGRNPDEQLTAKLFRAQIDRNVADWSAAIDPHREALEQYASTLAWIFEALPE